MRETPGLWSTPLRALTIPGIKALRDLRQTLSFGRLPPMATRSPEDCARITIFRTVEELCRFLEAFRRRVEAGERCRIVEREHQSEPGRFVVEFTIEVVTGAGGGR